jgi:hypothetical protein
VVSEVVSTGRTLLFDPLEARGAPPPLLLSEHQRPDAVNQLSVKSRVAKKDYKHDSATNYVHPQRCT